MYILICSILSAWSRHRRKPMAYQACPMTQPGSSLAAPLLHACLGVVHDEFCCNDCHKALPCLDACNWTQISLTFSLDSHLHCPHDAWGPTHKGCWCLAVAVLLSQAITHISMPVCWPLHWLRCSGKHHPYGRGPTLLQLLLAGTCLSDVLMSPC